MKRFKILIFSSMMLGMFWVEKVNAFCVYNKTDKDIIAYFSKDRLSMKRFIAGWIGTNSVILAAETLGPSVLDAVKSSSGDSSVDPMDILEKVQENSSELKENLSNVIDISGKGMPAVGDLLSRRGGNIGDLGRLIAQGSTKVRWGKRIKKGQKACWNKDDIKKEISWIKSNSQKAYFLFLKELEEDKLYEFNTLGEYSIASGISAK